jgi:hypothetical protein
MTPNTPNTPTLPSATLREEFEALMPEPASVLLTDTDMARLHRRVTGAARFDPCALELMREVEHAVNERRAEPVWRCFLCDETFTDRAAAAEHFGTTELHEPACTIDVKKFRQMEALWQRALQDDSDTDRQMYAMRSEHQLALRREEEKGYARGLRDAVPGAAVWALPEAWLKDAAADAAEIPVVAYTLTECAMQLRKALETRK